MKRTRSRAPSSSSSSASLPSSPASRTRARLVVAPGKSDTELRDDEKTTRIIGVKEQEERALLDKPATAADLMRDGWIRPLVMLKNFQVLEIIEHEASANVQWNRFKLRVAFHHNVFELVVSQSSRTTEYDIQVSDMQLSVIDLHDPKNPVSKELQKLGWHEVNMMPEEFNEPSMSRPGAYRDSAARKLFQTMKVIRDHLAHELATAIEEERKEVHVHVVCFQGIERSLGFFNILAFAFSALCQWSVPENGDLTRATFLTMVTHGAPIRLGRYAADNKTLRSLGSDPSSIAWKKTERGPLEDLFKAIAKILSLALRVDTASWEL